MQNDTNLGKSKDSSQNDTKKGEKITTYMTEEEAMLCILGGKCEKCGE